MLKFKLGCYNLVDPVSALRCFSMMWGACFTLGMGTCRLVLLEGC